MNSGKWIGVNVLVEVLTTEHHDDSFIAGDGMLHRDFSPSRRNVGIYLGYKLSSKPGLVLNGVALLTAGALATIVLASIIVSTSGS